MNAGAEGGGSLGGIDDVNLVALLLDGHADAEVVAALVLAHAGVFLGVVKVGVGVEHAQHARNRPVVEDRVGLVAGDGLGVILLDQRIDAAEGAETVAQLALVLRRLGPHLALQNAAHDGADSKKQNHGNESAACAGSHRREKPPDRGAAGLGKQA